MEAIRDYSPYLDIYYHQSFGPRRISTIYVQNDDLVAPFRPRIYQKIDHISTLPCGIQRYGVRRSDDSASLKTFGPSYIRSLFSAVVSLDHTCALSPPTKDIPSSPRNDIFFPWLRDESLPPLLFEVVLRPRKYPIEPHSKNMR